MSGASAAGKELVMNGELGQRGHGPHMANAFLSSVLRSLRIGIAVVDRELKLLAWNRQAGELWGMRDDEVTGRSLFDLGIGLPAKPLRRELRSCLTNDAVRQLELTAVDRKGRRICCKITCTPLHAAAEGAQGVILLMEEVQGIDLPLAHYGR